MDSQTHLLPISVIIPTLNRPDSLRDTLTYYMKGNSIPNEFIIVDQSQDNKLREETEDCLNILDKNIIQKYIYLKSPSLTKARNVGISNATNDIILLSDDDIRVYEDTINNLYLKMKSNYVSMVGGLDDNAIYHDSCLGYIAGVKSLFKRKIGGVSKSFFGRYPYVAPGIDVNTEWCMGYFFSVKKHLVEKWNLRFDEHLIGYAYAEDLDFSYSYYKHSTLEKYECMLSDSVRVKHMVSKEYRVPSRKSTFMLILHRYYLIHKHDMGIPSILLSTYTNIVLAIERLIKRENPADIFKAMSIYLFHKKEVNSGKLAPFLDKL